MNNIKLFLKKNFDKQRKWKPIIVKDDKNGLAVVCNSVQFSSLEIKQLLSDLHHITSTRGMLRNYNHIYK